MVMGIFKALFGPKRSPWIDLVDTKVERGDEATRVTVTLVHNPKVHAPVGRSGVGVRFGTPIPGFPVLIPDPPEIVLGGRMVKSPDWKGSGDIAIEEYGTYPEGYDTTGHVTWGHSFDFVFDVPVKLVSGTVEARVHYLQYGHDCNSPTFSIDLP